MQDRKRDTDVQNKTFGLCGRRRGWDVSREQHRNMYIIYGERDHQSRLDPWTSARAWYTGKTQSDRVERKVGGGIGMQNTCKSTADSCQCMTKSTKIL